jgi:hypothetical protein
MSRGSVDDIASGYELDDQGVRVRVLVESLMISTSALSSRVKRPGSEATHSPPTSAEFKNM